MKPGQDQGDTWWSLPYDMDARLHVLFGGKFRGFLRLFFDDKKLFHRNYCVNMPPKKLKIWADELSNNNSLADDDVKELKIETSIGEYDQFMQVVNKSRHDVAKSLEDFKFDKTRVRILSDHAKESCINGPVLYWMARDGRVEDNWAMIFSQKLAIKFEVPLHVCYCLVPTFLGEFV